MFVRKMRKILFAVILLSFAPRLFAIEEYVTEAYKQIDSCFTAKDESKLNSLLASYTKDKYYYLLENYTQKKIRRLIVVNDYDFAMEATLILIENNLDNEEAVEMYSVISDAYEIQRKHELEIEYQKQLEQARLQAEKEKQRGNVEKEYVAASKTTTGSVYVSGKETKLTSSNWKVAFGLVNLGHLMEPKGKIGSLHYGVDIDFNYKYTMDKKAVIGTDVFAGFQFLAIADKEKMIPLLGDLDAAFKMASPSLSKNLFIRAGFDAIITGKSREATDTKYVLDNFYSPYIGLKLEDLSLGKIRLSLGADWLAGHLFYKNVKVAAGGGLNLEFPFAELEKVKLNLNIGVKDKFFMKDSGIENRASVILAIGVENVVR